MQCSVFGILQNTPVILEQALADYWIQVCGAPFDYLSSTLRFPGLYLVHRSLTVAPGLSPQYSMNTSRNEGGVRPGIEQACIQHHL